MILLCFTAFVVGCSTFFINFYIHTRVVVIVYVFLLLNF